MPKSAVDIVLSDPTRPCPCGSSKIARECCLDDGGRIVRVPRPVDIPRPDGSYQNPRCYASTLGGCSPKISREHFLSRCVLERAHGGKAQLFAHSFPWITGGKARGVSAGNLQAKVLCRRHNEALSPYDQIGDRFTRLVVGVGEPEHKGPLVGLFNGEDVERWFLKTLCGVVAMERGRARWTAPDDWLHALFKTSRTASFDLGLWLNLEEAFAMFDDGLSFSITPIDAHDGGAPYGLRFHIANMEWVLLTDRRGRSAAIRNGRCRPGVVTIQPREPYPVAHIGLRYAHSPLGMHLTARSVLPEVGNNAEEATRPRQEHLGLHQTHAALPPPHPSPPPAGASAGGVGCYLSGLRAGVGVRLARLRR